MARRKQKSKHHRRITRRLSRSNQRRNAKPKKASRKVAAKRGKIVAQRKARRATAAKKAERRVQRKPTRDPRLEIAVKDMNRGSSLTAAARSVNLPPKTLQSFVTQHRVARRKRGRWTIKDNRPRRVPVITKGRIRVVTVDGYEQARLVGQHYQAAGDFVRTNDLEVIRPFDGQTVRPVKGNAIPLETDPNALHRIAAMDSPPFHEIYEIVSPT